MHIAATTQAFQALHESGCFLLPNPWDVGSAKLLAGMGFQAVASTSSGFAWSRGRPDNNVSMHQVLDHLRELTGAISIPVNADFEGGFAVNVEDVFAHFALAARTGVAGISIEDSTGSSENPLFDFALSVERVRAARRAIDESQTGIVLTGRTEGFIVGRPDLTESLRRLVAYAEAGADCLYAPGIRSIDDLATVVKEVAPKPVNALVHANFTTVAELADIGVRRISVGGALARTAYSAFVHAAQEIQTSGTFGAFGARTAATDFDSLFA
ncbi:MAG: isocitrate lyase/phosphoenolpyruvate mutase family protein [Phycisphaerae bacterium]|nr:isocitrate lyase/phosphoenolpyruvate mutase family protein [Gemmatimonadaceae bacterium]